jgi:hypothetical protein
MVHTTLLPDGDCREEQGTQADGGSDETPECVMAIR